MEKLKWSELKTFIDQRNARIQYIDFGNHYRVIALDGPLGFCCAIDKVNPTPTGSDQEDFEDNYQELANSQVQDHDEHGRTIIRSAATRKGWHYQAHSIQFEVNKLNSIYNKDADGNDLGFASIKIYKANGDECTTQTSADVDGVKTIIKWQPDFDFEIISGNIRQVAKETVDSYVYVRLQAATGLAAPNDFLPVYFVEGGINLNYIGADEPLKTDGRASKMVKCDTNGDFFEIIINYEADLLTNENRHKMSVVFEIYKDPTS